MEIGDEISKANAGSGAITEASTKDLHNLVEFDWMSKADKKLVKKANDAVKPPAAFKDFLQEPSGHWTICFVEPALLLFTMQSFCSMRGSPRCRDGSSTIFFFPIRCVPTWCSRLIAGSTAQDTEYRPRSLPGVLFLEGSQEDGGAYTTKAARRC